MSLRERKQNLLEEVMKVNDEAIIEDLQTVLNKAKRKKNKSSSKEKSILDFAGIWTKEEGEEMKRLIEESCETVHPDDWK